MVTPSGDIQKLQRVQNSAARIVLQAPRRSHTKPLLRQLHWLPVQHRITYKGAGGTDVQGPDHIYAVAGVPEWSHQDTRQRADSTFDHVHSIVRIRQYSFAKRAFRCSAPATWNSLPRTATDNDSLGTFKSRLDISAVFLWH